MVKQKINERSCVIVLDIPSKLIITLGVVGVVGVLVADASNNGHFEGGNMPNFIGNPPPLFNCFRTQSDVHPVRTKSLSENSFHIF